MICGIDPGKKGATALLYPNGTVYVDDLPFIGIELSGALLVETFRELRPEHCYIEAINSFKMGRQSAFNFGQGYGVILGVLAALGIPFTKISPARWKKHFHLPADKDLARLMATRRFPASADRFKRKKDDGRAEAALIALWGSETQ